MGAVALILARSGSKGVPGKNIASVAGRPCIAWTIDDAKRAESVARIVVSTDGEEIARVARAAGVEVVMRPPELANDTARVDDAARHAVLEAERTGAPGDPIVILYGNVPVRPEGLIDRVVRMLEDTTADSAQSFAPVGKHHPWWTARVDSATGALRPWEGLMLNHGVFRRQDLPPAFVPDGGALAVRRRALFLQVSGVAAGPHAFFGSDRRGVVTDEGAVVDIDCEIDLIVADALLQRRKPSPIKAIGRKSA